MMKIMKKNLHERFQQKRIDEKKPLHELSHGERLRILRERVGLSQGDVATSLGISVRKVSYYEIEATYPPFLKVVRDMCSLYGVSADELLGIKPMPELNYRTLEAKLYRIFYKIKKLPAHRKRALFNIMDALIELEELKKEKEK